MEEEMQRQEEQRRQMEMSRAKEEELIGEDDMQNSYKSRRGDRQPMNA